MAREVTVDSAPGWRPASPTSTRRPMRENHVRARIVVLAASACESARILLNSKSAKFPQGLGNSSGDVGKYLTDSTGTGVTGFIPKLMDGVPHNEDGVGGMHLYMPWWLDNKKLDFPRGYHIEIGGGRRMPGAGFIGGIHNYTRHRRVGHAARVRRLRQEAEGRLPPPLRRDGQLRRPRRDGAEQGQLPARSTRASSTSAASRCCASTSSGATTRSSRRSTCRRPSAPSSTRWAARRLSAMPTRSAGLRARRRRPDHPRARRDAHGQRSERRRSLNKNCQAHDAKNVFVADGGPFVSQADKNCTWTILALAMRTSRVHRRQRKKGNDLAMNE